jgi:adenylate cyclase
MLNTFQSALEDIITRHAGTIVKTPGDAILAVFWKDVGQLNHAACALRSGQAILDDLPDLQRSWEAVGATLDIGIGIDSGQVAMGLVGKRHLEPTVIGDAVNVAQRLETLTKTLGCPLIFSENVRERLREDVEAVCFDEVMVRGRQTPLRVYGLAGPGTEVRGPGQEVDLVGQGDE